jgi:hypothetical protein
VPASPSRQCLSTADPGFADSMFAAPDASCRVHHGGDGEVDAWYPKAHLSAWSSRLTRHQRIVRASMSVRRRRLSAREFRRCPALVPSALAPVQNKPVAMVRVRQPPLPATFYVVSACLASIYACQACNILGRSGAMSRISNWKSCSDYNFNSQAMKGGRGLCRFRTKFKVRNIFA